MRICKGSIIEALDIRGKLNKDGWDNYYELEKQVEEDKKKKEKLMEERGIK